METGRDDFIIAVRSAFLQKGVAQRFSLLVLIIISVVLLSLDFYKSKPLNIFRSFLKDIIYRGSHSVSLPFNFLDHQYVVIKDHFNLYNNYENLKVFTLTYFQTKNGFEISVDITKGTPVCG